MVIDELYVILYSTRLGNGYSTDMFSSATRMSENEGQSYGSVLRQFIARGAPNNRRVVHALSASSDPQRENPTSLPIVIGTCIA